MQKMHRAGVAQRGRGVEIDSTSTTTGDSTSIPTFLGLSSLRESPNAIVIPMAKSFEIRLSDIIKRAVETYIPDKHFGPGS
jgi:hypothetical protein